MSVSSSELVKEKDSHDPKRLTKAAFLPPPRCRIPRAKSRWESWERQGRSGNGACSAAPPLWPFDSFEHRFIVLLSAHPYFKIHALGASARSAGRTYKEATRWKQSVPIPKAVEQVIVRECKADQFKGCEIVFSGLDSDVAGEIGQSSPFQPRTVAQNFCVEESAFRSAELAVFSNAGNYRRDPLCPLVVPLVNTSHFDILPHQRALHSPPLSKGFIVTNANCSTTGLAIPLKALEDAFGRLECVMVTTMQAISGGGYPGVSSMDILDNVVPLIGGEEEKMEWELSKILGGISSDATEFDLRKQEPMKISAACNRVPVLDGHTECASIRFVNRPPPTPEQVKDALRKFTCEVQDLQCPSAPQQAIFVHEEPDRPQPRLDRYFQNGSGVSVGRVRVCPVMDIKFVVLANNVSIGAATSSIINVRSFCRSRRRSLIKSQAEYAVAKGIV